jgi:hypothetical protein
MKYVNGETFLHLKDYNPSKTWVYVQYLKDD